MVEEIKQILLRFGLMLALIFGLFWFLKHSTRVNISANDKSMNEVSFPEGGYSVNTALEKITDLKKGDVVAYSLTGDAANRHVARVVGVEGQRVAIAPGNITVDGAPFGFKVELEKTTIAEFKVPRGCAYLLADIPANGSDSLKNGPIPFLNILGTIKPVKP